MSALNFIGKDRRKAPRIRIKVRIDVMVKTLGGSDSYLFRTEDVSESGALIVGDRMQYPFQDATLLDVELDFGDGNKIVAMAKPVRKIGQESFGIRFIQIDDAPAARLRRKLQELAEADAAAAGQDEPGD